jgi:hypothetical protein
MTMAVCTVINIIHNSYDLCFASLEKPFVGSSRFFRIQFWITFISDSRATRYLFTMRWGWGLYGLGVSNSITWFIKFWLISAAVFVFEGQLDHSEVQVDHSEGQLVEYSEGQVAEGDAERQGTQGHTQGHAQGHHDLVQQGSLRGQAQGQIIQTREITVQKHETDRLNQNGVNEHGNANASDPESGEHGRQRKSTETWELGGIVDDELAASASAPPVGAGAGVTAVSGERAGQITALTAVVADPLEDSASIMALPQTHSGSAMISTSSLKNGKQILHATDGRASVSFAHLTPANSKVNRKRNDSDSLSAFPSDSLSPNLFSMESVNSNTLTNTGDVNDESGGDNMNYNNAKYTKSGGGIDDSNFYTARLSSHENFNRTSSVALGSHSEPGSANGNQINTSSPNTNSSANRSSFSLHASRASPHLENANRSSSSWSSAKKARNSIIASTTHLISSSSAKKRPLASMYRAFRARRQSTIDFLKSLNDLEEEGTEN